MGGEAEREREWEEGRERRLDLVCGYNIVIQKHTKLLELLNV